MVYLLQQIKLPQKESNMVSTSALMLWFFTIVVSPLYGSTQPSIIQQSFRQGFKWYPHGFVFHTIPFFQGCLWVENQNEKNEEAEVESSPFRHPAVDAFQSILFSFCASDTVSHPSPSLFQVSKGFMNVRELELLNHMIYPAPSFSNILSLLHKTIPTQIS